MLKIHNELTRKVFACMNCYKQLFPIEIRYSCGICEYHDYCKSCWNKAKKNNKLNELHKHYLYHDYIFPEVDSSSLHNTKSIADALNKTFNLYSERSLIGIRPIKENNKIETSFYPDYKWITYRETKDISLSLGQGLLLLLNNKQSKFIGICSISCPQWLLAQYSCFLKGLIPVPLHASFNSNQISHIINLANISILFISKHLLRNLYNSLGKLKYNHSLQHIIFINDYECGYSLNNNDYSIDILSNKYKNISFWEWDDIIQKGNKHSHRKKLIHCSGNDIGMLLSTSGSSGMPKLTEFSCLRIQNIFKGARPLSEQMVILSIEPVRQSMDLLCKGGRIGIYCGRIDKLTEDIQCLRPTALGATPSFWNNLYCEYQQDFKLYLENNPKSDESDFMQIYKDRHLFGNRLKAVLTGGAPLNKTIQEWLFIALGALVVNGYGTTETGGLSSSGSINPGVQLQLLDCPELGYLTSDKPYSRGEILAYSNNLINGYYNEEDKTKEAFIIINNKRYFKTGDIGRLINGKIEIIDRKKSMLKLAQGCFIAPEYLETLFVQCSFIKQIFIYGDSYASCVTCVVVPSEIICENNNTNEYIEKSIRKQIRELGIQSELKSWEIPQIIIIEYEPFTVSNGLLTTIGKSCRPNLIKKYKSQLELLWNKQNNIIQYNSTNNNEDIHINNIKPNNTGLCNGLVDLLVDILNLPISSIHSSDSILQLGADSLTLARLSSQIKKRFGSDIPLPVLVKLPDLFVLQTAIFSGVSSISSQLSKNNKSKEFLENEVKSLSKELQNEVNIIKIINENRNDILLTGANGFLGCFLLYSLLNDSLRYKNKNIICIIRGKNDLHALQRLKDSIAYYKVNIDNYDRIDVISGDISRPYFGLTKDKYLNLCSNISIVFHNAAMVNSIYSYEQHKPSNVYGVMEILKFISHSTPPKELHHISTVGMLGGEINEKWKVKLSNNHEYMGGYGQSKWIGEQIILNYNELNGGILNIYRPSTIFSSKCGASNITDTIISMICGLLTEKIYCKSFFELEEDKAMLPGEMNIVGVEWVADSIISLSHCSNNIFHITNSNLTSLGTIIEYIQRYGIPLKQVNEIQFKKQISDITKEDHPFFIVKSIIINEGYRKRITKVNCDKTNQVLQKLGKQIASELSYSSFKNTITFLLENRIE